MTISIKKISIIICGVMSVVIAAGIWKGASALEEAAQQKKASLIVRPVKTITVGTDQVSSERLFPGKVRSGKRVNLAFSVPGVLEYLNASEGMLIKKGTVIARLDPRDYRYRYDSAKAKYVQSESELKRLRYLLGKKLVTQACFDQQDMNYTIARADYESSQKALSDTVLRAPFDGVIAKRNLENGEHVQADQIIVSVQDISDIEIIIQVPETFIANKNYLKKADFIVQLNVDQIHWFPARVIEHRIESSSSTNTYDVVVAINPVPGLDIYPGMTAQVKVSQPVGLSRQSSVGMRLPSDSVLFDASGQAFVWVIPADGGKPEKRSVTLAAYLTDSILITKGLHRGERVAVSGLQSIDEDQMLRPMVNGKEGLDG